MGNTEKRPEGRVRFAGAGLAGTLGDPRPAGGPVHPADIPVTVTAEDLERRAVMLAGCHYDYRRQQWVDGHDHAHEAAGHPEAVAGLVFCGADLATCNAGGGGAVLVLERPGDTPATLDLERGDITPAIVQIVAVIVLAYVVGAVFLPALLEAAGILQAVGGAS